MPDYDQLNGAVCRRHDPDLWHNDDTEAEAVALCLTGDKGSPCPALQLCLEMATDPDQRSFTKSGVWGGMNAVRRGQIRAQRERAATQHAERETSRYQTVTFTAPKRRTPMQESSL